MSRERPILFSGPMVRAILEGRKTQTRRVVKRLRAQPRHDVTQDFADLLPGIPLSVDARWTYDVDLNPQGAVSARVTTDGRGLGLKPGEFDFVCPYAEGHTYLRDKKTWTIQTRGDRLWVKETWRFLGTDMMRHGRTHPVQEGVFQYEANGAKRTIQRPWEDIEHYMNSRHGTNRRPSLFMKRWFSRITLPVTGVRVERLQDISEEDAWAEGLASVPDLPDPYADSFGLTTPGRAGYAQLWERINGKGSWSRNPWVWVVEFKRAEAKSEAA